MKKFMFLIVLMAFACCFGCDNTASNDATTPAVTPTKTPMIVTVKNSDILMNAAKTEVSAKAPSRVTAVGEDVYPHVVITAKFYVDFIYYPDFNFKDSVEVFSQSLDPTETTLTLLDLNHLGNWGDPTIMGYIACNCANDIDNKNTVWEIPADRIAYKYDITVAYYVSATEFYTGMKTYYIDNAKFIQKMLDAGFTTRDNGMGVDYSPNSQILYKYTAEQAKKVALTVSYDVTTDVSTTTSTTIAQ